MQVNKEKLKATQEAIEEATYGATRGATDEAIKGIKDQGRKAYG